MEGRPGTRYREEPEDDEPKNTLNNRQPLIIIAVSVVLSLLVGFVWANSNLVMRTPYETDITGIVDDMETVKQEVATSTTAVDNAVANLANTVTAQVNNSLTQVTNRLNNVETNTNSARELATSTNAQVGTISSDVGTLKAGLADANAKITALQNGLTASNARIAVLEGKLATSDDVVDATIPFSYSVSLRDDGFPTGADNRTSLSLRVILSNPTGKDIEDVSMEFEVELYGDDEDIDIGFRPRVSLSGWRVKEWGMDYIMLKGTGLVVDSKDKYSKIMNIEIQWTGETSGEAEIDDDYIEVTNWSYE